eukprot:TRINITY_DN386_c0_g1_i8.p1 TRINITY_DN386_c0_g1~~TRINITY_DN386_c0_g1_i8.p1  ORF type:complete len:255 (-),score=43.95 TRINITY_DN386_c0_g1_i8:315-1079(-)
MRSHRAALMRFRLRCREPTALSVHLSVPAICLAQRTNPRGTLCAPQCASDSSCPTDKPAGTLAPAKCLLQDSASGKKYCALVCAADFMCGVSGAKCSKVAGPVGVCTYPTAVTSKPSTPMTVDKEAAETESASHYEKPPCGSDEVQAQVQGANGTLCAPQCASDSSCPTDKPAGTLAPAKCLLQDSASGKKYCALVCAADFMCGVSGAKCSKVAGPVGVCTYPGASASKMLTPMAVEAEADTSIALEDQASLVI